MPHVSPGSHVCTEYARTLIRVKARQIVRRPGFNRSEIGDVENDLYLHLLGQAQQFDPARGSINTFIARVVDLGIRMLLRERRRSKRAPAAGIAVQSLQMMVDQPEGPPSPLWATLSQADAERRTGGDSMSNTEMFELADDVAALIDNLSPELQAVCRSRMTGNRTETERVLGLGRRKYDAAVEQIREHFAQGGFGEI